MVLAHLSQLFFCEMPLSPIIWKPGAGLLFSYPTLSGPPLIWSLIELQNERFFQQTESRGPQCGTMDIVQTSYPSALGSILCIGVCKLDVANASDFFQKSKAWKWLSKPSRTCQFNKKLILHEMKKGFLTINTTLLRLPSPEITLEHSDRTFQFWSR